ncbi:DUF4365 domain-containing protein [Streptococcus agalactiae]|uniref:DUF4365 domain-containing protein n=2 Tax=Streptococcus agalactiae TaxID=1311 RepID=UPI00030931D9|nr:DUF4365 domain-containing protein [Streptococcus agalactiae]EPX01618.1 hypothetical protein SAG0148_04105 [Streptococcus agalactiae MRI Z1-049]EQA91416.1 hypothetical protein SAG0145_09495 [Streptococcus agalactiae MRI Z1-038]
MDKSSKQIEEDAVDFLKLALKKSKHINREISEGDREPIWDGHIYFYKNVKKQNIDLVERIPIQVKGKDSLYNEKEGYPIKRSNLEHYLNEGGVLYFVVYLRDDIPTVTYASLTPKVIKKILLASDKKKPNIKSISVSMKLLADNEKELNFIFFNFIEKRKHQKGFTHMEWRSHNSLFDSSGNLDGELQLKFIGKEYLDILEYAKSGELDLYYKPKGAVIPVPLIDDISNLQLFEEKEMLVQIQGKERIYKTIFAYETKNDFTIDFRNGCSITVHKRPDLVTLTFNYSLSNILSKRLDGLEFILELQKNKGITLNRKRLEFSNENIAKIDFNFLKKAFNANIRLKELVDKLKISTDLDSTGWSQKDARTIELLYDGIVNEQAVTLDRVDYNPTQVIQFANIHVLLFLIPENEGTKSYKLYNFSDYDMVLINEDKQLFSKYETVELEQLLLIDNFNISDYLSSYLSSESKIENMDLGLLKLINYADSKHDQNTLQFCLKFAQKLVDMDKSENNILNLLQIKKRLNNLTQKDSSYLHSLMNHNSVEIRFATNCILGYKDQAIYLFENEFSDEQRERFIEYPIYNLLNL